MAALNTCIHMVFLWACERVKIDLVAHECEAEGFKKVYLDKTEEFTHVVLCPRITVRNDDGSKVHRALKPDSIGTMTPRASALRIVQVDCSLFGER